MTPLGKVSLVALATLVVTGAFLELGALIAIVSFLLFMLGLPIYLGWKSPRQLAVAGLVALLVAAPIGSTLYAEQIRTPTGAVSSDPENGGSVVANAGVTPFSAATGSVFEFHATLNPQFLPAGAHAPEYALLYLSTCAGATTSNASFCGGGGYPFWELNQSFNITQSASETIQFHQQLNTANLWWWLMAFVYQNVTNVTRWVWVDPANQYGGVQGPVSGDLASTIVLILPALYQAMFLYVGVVFFGALIIYVWLKTRGRQRNPPVAEPSGRGPGNPSAPPGSPPNPTPTRDERSCPNCQAVVYPSERTCWKCGVVLDQSAPPTPLKSGS